MRFSNARAAPMPAVGPVPSKSFINRCLAMVRKEYYRPKCVLRVQYGTATKLNRERRVVSPFRLHNSPRSRTPVTRFSGCARYRFFEKLPGKWPHGYTFQEATAYEEARGRRRFALGVFAWRLVDFDGGYTAGAVEPKGGNLLLPLRRRTHASGLREILPIAEIRFARVGDELR